MKKTKKLLAFLLAMVMVLAMGMTAMAAEIYRVEGITGPASITVTLPNTQGETADNTYKIYKVFDATTAGDAISYKLVDGVDEYPSSVFRVDDQGNVSFYNPGQSELGSFEIEPIINYVKEYESKMLVATVETSASDKSFTVGNLPYGYYYITTTTGSLVTVDSTTPNATVKDKNTVPTLDKIISDANSLDEDGKKALAQVGTTVKYTATITVGNGAIGYVFHDKMSAGLKYNGDVTVSISDNLYTVKQIPDEGDTITIQFKDGITSGTTITITYSATVTSDALTVEPAKNTAYVSYGDSTSTNETPVSETKTWNAQISVTKKDGKNTEETTDDTVLAGAGFVLKNSAGKYYHLDETNKDNPVVEWLDNIADADEHVSGADGKVAPFTGLANGTYTLEEKTVPAGYNKAADTEITIAEHNYESSNLEQSATVINNKGTELPSTGGIGTTMFYVIGGALVLVAVVLLVTRKRMSVEK